MKQFRWFVVGVAVGVLVGVAWVIAPTEEDVQEGLLSSGRDWEAEWQFLRDHPIPQHGSHFDLRGVDSTRNGDV